MNNKQRLGKHLKLLWQGIRFGFWLAILWLPACSSSPQPFRHPLPTASPHLYFYKSSELFRVIHRTRPDIGEGFIVRDPSHTSVRFGEFGYPDVGHTFEFRDGSLRPIPVFENSFDVARHAAALADLNERILGADDSCTLYVTYVESAGLIRIREREDPSRIVFELKSDTPPQQLFSMPGRLYLVTGPNVKTQLGPIAIPGTRPNPPRHLFILNRSSSVAVERDVTVPAADVLDVDPWSDNVLAEEFIWVGYTPLFSGQDVWQRNRFLYNLSTGRRIEIPLASGIANLPEGFFLRSDLFSRQ